VKRSSPVSRHHDHVGGDRISRATDADQTAADVDQTGSDADQTAADIDETAAARDEADAASDQLAADQDQETADHQRLTWGAGPTPPAYEASRLARATSSINRLATHVARLGTARSRILTAIKRDANAASRDVTARRRDEEAEALAQSLAVSDESLEQRLAEISARAAADRAQAAADRLKAAEDRAEAARERELLQAELHNAHLDDLTGAFRRETGRLALRHEIDRARRADGRFVVAFVDIDGMKTVNDRDGHAAGDHVLQTLVWTLRSNLRSFDPVVRYGGDEFVCGIGGIDIGDVERRFAAIDRALLDDVGVGISVGLAGLEPDDTLERITARADAALLDAKKKRRD
jgi:diguanylate cyclase (GGDEF)-like protein